MSAGPRIETLPAVVSTEWLAERLGRAGLRAVDASWYLPATRRDAAAEYEAGHIPGAVFFDLDASNTPGDDAVFTERVQYMFHSPAIDPGNPDQLTDGGGPAFLPNENRGPDYARRTAQGIGTEAGEHRLGHLSTLQRSSRATDGTPIHIRMDGPGFDGMDVPGGVPTPKLQFTVFVPTADFFTTMRRNAASLDLAAEFGVDDDENGLERFLTATRRQNFLVPPRRHRAFPLVEFT